MNLQSVSAQGRLVMERRNIYKRVILLPQRQIEELVLWIGVIAVSFQICTQSFSPLDSSALTLNLYKYVTLQLKLLSLLKRTRVLFFKM